MEDRITSFQTDLPEAIRAQSHMANQDLPAFGDPAKMHSPGASRLSTRNGDCRISWFSNVSASIVFKFVMKSLPSGIGKSSVFAAE